MAPPIPDAALDDRLAVVGTAGSGKTYLALSLIERLLELSSRVVAIDPLDVAWGLRLLQNGKPSPFQIVILGGQHGDLPINEHSGALIGETVAKSADSFIISLGSLGTKTAERRFMLAFLTALYRHLSGHRLHLVIDEADMFAPQRLLDKEGEAAKLLGQMETIVRRGRVKGFIPWLITQRPAVLSKDVLSQADGLVALKLTSSQDRDAIGAWIEGQADRQQGKEILASLPTMQRGQGVVWIPGRSILKTMAFPPKLTFDSSAAPKPGEVRRAAELPPLDLGTLKDRLAAVAKDADENDPRKLKAKIAALEAQARKAPQGASPEQLAAARAEGRERGLKEGRAESAAEIRKLQSAINKASAALSGRESAPDELHSMAIREVSVRPTPTHRETPVSRSPRQGAGNSALPVGERAVLTACAQYHDGVSRDQLTILTGYKRSTRDAYVQRLREKGLVENSGQLVIATDEGFDALGSDFEPLPTGDALRDHWLARLPEGERAVLEVLVEAHPEGVERLAIDEATGFKRSTRDAYLQRLKSRRLIMNDGGLVRASDDLFG